MKAPASYSLQPLTAADVPPVTPSTWLRSQKYTAEAFAAADHHALQVSRANHASFKDLLYELVHSVHWSPMETLRVLFRWMTAKDMFGIQFSNECVGPQEDVLLGFKKQKATYGSIFELLCMHSGIPCFTVVGYAKGTQFRPGQKFGKRPPNHSWNVVYIEGSWQLVDCHWATRFLKSSDSGDTDNMVYEYDDFYFCTDPRQLVYSHFPLDAKWQLLNRPLSQDEFEDLPIAKSNFFLFGMSFLSHHSAVITTTSEGGLALSLGNPSPLVYSFHLVPTGEQTVADSLKKGSAELVRCCMQETKPAQVNYFLLPPRRGHYYFTVYASSQAPDENVVIERMYHAVCEYKVVAQVAATGFPLLPPAADSNWGPGPVLYQSGLLPHQQEAAVKADPKGHAEVGFDATKPEIRVLARVRHDELTPQECELCVKLSPPSGQADSSKKISILLDLPRLGRYTLEVYANNPATDGNTFVHVCQYLLVVSDDDKPSASDAANPVFLETDQRQCYEYDGQKATVPVVSPETQQLARRLDGVRRSPPNATTAAGLCEAAALVQKVPHLHTQLAQSVPGAAASGSAPSSWTPATVRAPAAAASALAPVAYAQPNASFASEDVIVPSQRVAKVQAAPPQAASGSVVVGGAGGLGGLQFPSSENAAPEYRGSASGAVGGAPQVGVSAPQFGVSAAVKPFGAGLAVGATPASAYPLQAATPQTAVEGQVRPPVGGVAARIQAFNAGTVAPVDGEPGATTVDGTVPPVAGATAGLQASTPPLSGGAPLASFSASLGAAPTVDVGKPVLGGGAKLQASAPVSGQVALGATARSQPAAAVVEESLVPSAARSQAAAAPPALAVGVTVTKNGQPPTVGADESFVPSAQRSQASAPLTGSVSGSISKSKPGASLIGGALFAGAAKLQASALLTAGFNSGLPDEKGRATADTEESFPPPPPASQLLTFDPAPARAKSEVPVAPKDFEPVKLVASDQAEPVPIPEPLPETEADKLSFSVRRAQQFRSLDEHAVQVSSTEHNSFKDLIWDLIYSKNITDELEIARLIFLWLCTKDLSKIKFDKVTPGSPEEILQGLKDSKSTYAKIYDILCSYAGLHSTVVTGYAKGVDYKPGMSFKGSTAFHSWNAVRIHGHYRLIDCHWASRRIVGKKGQENIRYELDDYYFLVDPRQLIYTHYPEEERWQMLKKPYSLSDYEDLPPVKSLFFRYNLQLNTHQHAVIKCKDEFRLELNYQRYVGPGLDFTFSLQTEDGKEAVDGVKLSRYGLHEVTADQFALFYLRAPSAKDAYRLTIFAREARPDNAAAGKTYSAVVEYKIACDLKAAMKPFPSCLAASWGLSVTAAKAAGIVPSPSLLPAILNTSNGECQVSFAITRPLLFACHLKGGPKEAELPGAALCRVFGDSSAAVFSVSAPGKGEYGLEIFVNDPSCDGKTLRHLCQYLVACDEKHVSGLAFPALPTAYLGPQQPVFDELGLSTAASSRDPFVVVGDSGEAELELAVSRPIRGTASLSTVGDERELDDYVLQLLRDGVLSFRVRPPAVGLFKLQVFAQPLDDVSDSLPGVYNALLRVVALPKRGALTAFPRQFSAWKEGCYLFEPVDGELAAAFGKSRPSHIPFRVKVPQASKVAVVAGSEWTHLEPSAPGSDVFVGKANMAGSWGVETTVALTASYGSDSGSYNTLLEFSI